MAEPVYEPFDEDRVRLVLVEEIYPRSKARGLSRSRWRNV
jgi:hypothetical protein